MSRIVGASSSSCEAAGKAKVLNSLLELPEGGGITTCMRLATDQRMKEDFSYQLGSGSRNGLLLCLLVLPATLLMYSLSQDPMVFPFQSHHCANHIFVSSSRVTSCIRSSPASS